MALLNILTSVEYNIGFIPCELYVNTSDTISQVMAAGYLNGQGPTYGVTFANTQMCLVNTTQGLIYLQISIVGGNTSLIYPQVPPVPSPVQSSASRSLNSGFQLSTTRNALVNYSVDISCTISLTTGQTGTVFLEIASDSGFTTNVQELGRSVNGNTGTLTLGLNLTQNATSTLGGYVPAGYYCRLRTANTVGTPTFNYRSGQEVLL